MFYADVIGSDFKQFKPAVFSIPRKLAVRANEGQPPANCRGDDCTVEWVGVDGLVYVKC